jgi:hypothetical protein
MSRKNLTLLATYSFLNNSQALYPWPANRASEPDVRKWLRATTYRPLLYHVGTFDTGRALKRKGMMIYLSKECSFKNYSFKTDPLVKVNLVQKN